MQIKACSILAAAILWLSPAAAAPAATVDVSLNSTLTDGVESFGCGSLAHGLRKTDCQYMSSIGMKGQGVNARKKNGGIWIGKNGANTFKFTNEAKNPSAVGVILVVWENSFVNAVRPKITYSLPNVGDSVTISVANGVSGGWAALTHHTTTLNAYGQIHNTWGEFTTGDYATVDVSREVNMKGNKMSIKVKKTGCTSNMNTCVFVCKSGTTCGASGTYNLKHCANGSQNGATYGTTADGNPSGGCTGFTGGGHLDIKLGRS